MIITQTDLPDIVKHIIESGTVNEGARIVALHGDLGAGKTTTAQEVAKELGVLEPVVSPTFVILKKYAINHSVYKTFVHIDAYRISNEAEAKSLRLQELFADASAFVIVEWPEHLTALLPQSAQHITLTYVDDTHRDILGI